MSFLFEFLEQSGVQPLFERVLALLVAPGVTDLVANGAEDWQLDSGEGLRPVTLDANAAELDQLARFLVALGDRHLDQLTPLADVAIGQTQLPLIATHGVARLRVHAVLASEVSDVTLLSVRVHRLRVPGLDVLVEQAMVSLEQARMLSNILDNRENFIISGATGSGKTTLLRALLAESPQLRTVAVEDTAEISPVEGVVSLQCRQSNVEGEGAIGLEQLAVNALRMRPDRLVVGEVRGVEAAVLVRAMNTGHRGSAATLHANSADAVASRLKALLAESGMTADAIDDTLATAVQWVIHLEASPTRRVAEIRRFQC